MVEKREKEILSILSKHCEYDSLADEWVVQDIHQLARAVYEDTISNTRCPDKLRYFIDYMNDNPDQRFLQGVRNYLKIPVLLSSTGFDHDINQFTDIKDTYHNED